MEAEGPVQRATEADWARSYYRPLVVASRPVHQRDQRQVVGDHRRTTEYVHLLRIDRAMVKVGRTATGHQLGSQNRAVGLARHSTETQPLD